MTIGEAYKQLSLLLHAVYNPRESGTIAGWVIEHMTGFTGSERVLHKGDSFTAEQKSHFQQITSQLLSHKPVQYVLKEAYFAKMKLYVDETVLIPRPETEELVEWIIEDVLCTMPDVRCSMLDVGTGSGCIGIALKKNLPDADVCVVDISEDALKVARQNAVQHKTDLHFSVINILDEEARKALPLFDYIISNPPYIKENEASEMGENVLKFEPHLALFVPDNNPLLFYDAISTFGLQHLKENGKLFFEINEAYGGEVKELLAAKGYTGIELKKDLQGKDRMIKAERKDAPNT